MKRSKSLFNQIIDYQNIRLAWVKARRGKTSKPAVINFSKNINENLSKIQRNLKSKPPVLSKYSQFKIYDPKERLISVVPFIDRVMHHAIMNILEGVFERQFIFHTYACRKGKGSHRAVKYAFEKTRWCKYFLKLDIHKYFDSIDHNILKNRLGRIIKDRECLSLLFSIIDSYGLGAKEKGLPIGNLTSQFFANFYLSEMDHHILEHLKPLGYVRYMDDFLLFSDSKEDLKNDLADITDFCKKNLGLSLNLPVLGMGRDGVPFLGYLVRKSGVDLTAKSRRRKSKKLHEINRAFEKGFIDEEKYCNRVVCLMRLYEFGTA